MAKSFHLIPGPRSFPIVGTLPHYLTNCYSFDSLHKNGMKKYKEFGPIVKEDIVPGVSILWLFKPDDIKSIFELEGKYPSRRSHLALEKYRLSKPELYRNAGLLPTNGPEWARTRSAFQFRPNVVDSLVPELEVLADEVAAIVRRKSMLGNVDMLVEFKKYFLEATVLFLFGGVRVGALKDNLDLNSKAQKLQDATKRTNENILKTDNGLQLWKYFPTNAYKQIKEGQETIEHIVKFLLRENEIKFPCKEGMNEKDKFTFVSDMLLAGIDTSAYTMSFVLYHLAKSKAAQDTLRSCCKAKDNKYGKMILKESLRLNPISVGVGRISDIEGVLSGYHVPRGTLMVSQNQVSCRNPAYFESPDLFMPERWLSRGHHPYLALPFGHGKRMCIGRRLAETSILVLMNHLISQFNFKWTSGKDLDCKSLLINQPNQPMIFKVTPE